MSSEFFFLSSLILVGIVFFSIFHAYIATQTEEAKKAEIQAEVERIAFIAHRISKDPSSYLQYCLDVTPSNITIEGGLLKYESGKYKFVVLVPHSIEDSRIFETTKVCFVKKNERVSLLSEQKDCNLNGICEWEECKLSCRDCYGPNSLCTNDNFCNLGIKENCKNSLDCSCSFLGQNYVCCPENPASNNYGCIYLSERKKKGERCQCNEECEKGLKCNPVSPSFNHYEKACCEEDKRWNGKECETIKTKEPSFIILLIQVNQEVPDILERAERLKEKWISITPLRNCPEEVEVVVAREICNDVDECKPLLTYARLIECARNYRYTRIVGVKHGTYVCKPGIGGYAPFYGIATIVADKRLEVYAAHELGHTFGLCDEGYGNSLCSHCASNICLITNSNNECVGSGPCCPNKPEIDSIMCPEDTCGRGCSFAPQFAPTSYAHLQKELNKYCGGMR